MGELLFFSKQEKLSEGVTVTVLNAWGTLNEITVSLLNKKIAKLYKQGFKRIVLKLSGGQDNTSAGITLLHHVLDEFQQKESQIKLVVITEPLYLYTSLERYTTEKEAIASFSDVLLSISETKLCDGSSIAIVKIFKIVDGTNVREFEELILEALTRGKHIIIDFYDARYNSSPAMGLLVKFADKFREVGLDVNLVSLPEKLIALFEMLGVLSLFKIHKTTEDAIASYNI